MGWIWLTFSILAISAIISLCLNFNPRLASIAGASGIAIAAVSGLYPVWQVLFNGLYLQTSIPWVLSLKIDLGLDALSAFFLLLIIVAAVVLSLYSLEYLEKWYGIKSIGIFWFFFNLLIASLLGIVIARNGFFFLIAWEAMSLTSFFLVAFEDEKKKVRRASLIYLIAANISAAFLIPFFILIDTGSFNFDEFASTVRPVVFFLAFAGFGIKAGIFPFHLWLPEVHPAAPSNVSAFMSGILIKMGIYGFLRLITFVDTPPIWWGGLFILTGIVSGVMGIAFAMGQINLKRMLAYSSIEHIGIIMISLGLGMLGLSLHLTLIALLGMAGAIFHVMNHFLFKSLLFMGSGAVFHATHSYDVNHLGGLIKKMPQTSLFFFIGVLAIAAIPSLNGFISEFMIYFAAFQGISLSNAVPFLAVLIALCIMGALTLAAFSGMFGLIFLGEPRSNAALRAHEIGRPIQYSMGCAAFLCIAVSLGFPAMIAFLSPVIGEMAKISPEMAHQDLFAQIGQPLQIIVILSSIIFLFAFVAFFVRKKTKSVVAVTWDCGFAAPTPRMQYTFASFVQPLTGQFKRAIPSLQKKIFPKHENLGHILEIDPIEAFFNKYVLKKLNRFSNLLRWIQHGYVNLYILYIFVALLFLLIFKFR